VKFSKASGLAPLLKQFTYQNRRLPSKSLPFIKQSPKLPVFHGCPTNKPVSSCQLWEVSTQLILLAIEEMQP
jgi:hypothetical protein